MILVARRIETEEQYQKSLDWLVTEAKRLEDEEEIHDPLLKPEKRDELIQKYDFVAAGVLDYQSRERSEWDPLHVDDSTEAEKNAPETAQVPIVAEPIEPEPPQPVTEVETKLSDFLDDD